MKEVAPPSTQIVVRNLQRAERVHTSSLQAAAEKALGLCLKVGSKKTQLHKLKEISVLLISDRRMTALHRRFLQQEGITDVITFDHGEIFISTETARRQARQFGNTLQRELTLYIVHGFLHLHGFDDRSARDAARMRKTQENIMAGL
jgi:probable rRNA maturation factor